MHERIKSHFAVLERALESTTLAAERKEHISKTVARLVALYGQFRETNESRFGDLITRAVQEILRQLEACPQAVKLGEKFRDRLGILHEDLGIPRLSLKPAKVPNKPKKEKARKA